MQISGIKAHGDFAAYREFYVFSTRKSWTTARQQNGIDHAPRAEHFTLIFTAHDGTTLF
jgi:hypothetical protein